MKTNRSPQQTLVACGRQFYERHWMWSKAGNLSVRLQPAASSTLEFAITPGGINKGHLKYQDLIRLKDSPSGLQAKSSKVAASSETAVHEVVYRTLPKAGAVFHVHPIYSTLISRFFGHPTQVRMLEAEWFEMMAGLGVGRKESFKVAILPSWPNPAHIARDLTAYLKKTSKPLPVVLIYNHGLTGWGETPEEARNHLEAMEYICQYLYLKRIADRTS